MYLADAVVLLIKRHVTFEEINMEGGNIFNDFIAD